MTLTAYPALHLDLHYRVEEKRNEDQNETKRTHRSSTSNTTQKVRKTLKKDTDDSHPLLPSAACLLSCCLHALHKCCFETKLLSPETELLTPVHTFSVTTAARPTFDPARGGNTARDKNAPIAQVGARDLLTHTKLKYRQPGQGGGETQDREILKAELRLREREHHNQIRREKGLPELEYDDGDDEDVPIRIDGDKDPADNLRIEAAPTSKVNIDADDSDDDADSSDSSDDSDEDDEEDDTAALMLELEKIKRERAEEKERQEREQAEQMSAERNEEIATGNPLLDMSEAASISSGPKDFSVKRRWDDDVIFKNQARGVDERPKKRFINDTLRSDFHRKFMSKYVQ